ncbi:hypothetical protein FB45DRAFT_1055736 [Roridomyces roridus]|uniref:F-box domain-containing protein n=1 Tax=Roridomyces roridus TaxID=1738132 RepID=A0AAD7C0U0_9AGAR|nr:hypothetical protein FB45DRAFT_1055736 [Roridomyces roridus]
MSPFPTEILELIIDEAKAWPSTITACSLVSRQWVSRARHHGFSRIDLVDNANKHKNDRITQFLPLLESPLATFISSTLRHPVFGLFTCYPSSRNWKSATHATPLMLPRCLILRGIDQSEWEAVVASLDDARTSAQRARAGDAEQPGPLASAATHLHSPVGWRDLAADPELQEVHKLSSGDVVVIFSHM